jgi:uncharacterized protein DUF4326
MTRVVHCKKEPFDVYVGRPSKFGNPFVVGRDGTRAQVIEKYRQWIYSQRDLLKELPSLTGKTLGCWCKPKACHGDVLVELCDNPIPDSRDSTVAGTIEAFQEIMRLLPDQSMP